MVSRKMLDLLVVFLIMVALLLALTIIPLAWAQEAIAISEVAWAGTNASSSDEYIELAGPGGLDLTGWRLEAVDGTPGVTLTGVISGSGFYLLERTNEETVASLPASQLYTGALSDGGEHLRLIDAQGDLVDEIDATAGWPGGDTSPERAAMERFGGEFVTNDCNNTSGALDAAGGTICGTPGAANLEPQPVNQVRFVLMTDTLVLSDSRPFVAQAWNSNGEGPEGSTMQFSLVSTSTEVVAIDPLTATMTASGQATVTVTGLHTGTAIIVAQWFGNLGGVQVRVVEPPQEEIPKIYLPLIIKAGGSTAQQAYPLGEAVALVQ